jgi:hypothetical protein
MTCPSAFAPSETPSLDSQVYDILNVHEVTRPARGWVPTSEKRPVHVDWNAGRWQRQDVQRLDQKRQKPTVLIGAWLLCVGLPLPKLWPPVPPRRRH